VQLTKDGPLLTWIWNRPVVHDVGGAGGAAVGVLE
jgi:hypothetical protein